MPFHKQNVLADALDVSAVGTLYSKVQRMQVANIGDGSPINVEIRCPVDAVGSGTLTISIETSNDNFSSDTRTLYSLPAKAAADLKKGKVYEGTLPNGVGTDIRLKFVTATGFTTAKVTAALRDRSN